VSRKLVKASVAASIVLALFTPAFVLLHTWMSESAKGTVRTGAPIMHQQSPQTYTPLKLDTPYFTASLPGNFTLKRQNTLGQAGPILFQLSANTDSTTDQQFGATIGAMPAEGLPGISDYKLRITDTARYTKYTFTGQPENMVAFHTIGTPAALTVFWVHGERYGELSVSSDGAASQTALENTLRSVVKSWNWK
jgi:hypothetical protein